MLGVKGPWYKPWTFNLLLNLLSVYIRVPYVWVLLYNFLASTAALQWSAYIYIPYSNSQYFCKCSLLNKMQKCVCRFWSTDVYIYTN